MATSTVRIQVGGHIGGRAPKYMLVDAEDTDLSAWKWSMHCAGYAGRQDRSSGRNRQVFAHRVIIERKLGRPLEPTERTDHANHNKLDNRRANLRPVSHAANLQNRIRPPRTNTSGMRGVTWDRTRQKWRAQVGHMGKGYNCGRYSTPEEAAAAAAAKRKSLGFLDKVECPQ